MDTLYTCKAHTYKTYLLHVDPVVEGPHGLEVVLHALFELLGDLVQGQEVLQVSPLGLVERSSGVHPLDYRCYVAEHDGMH